MSEEVPISPQPLDEQLRAADPTHNFAQRSARGGTLMILSYGIQVAIGIVGTAILARLLHPSDFGYLAMVMSIVNFIVPFREFLLAPAAFNQELSHHQASRLFWLNALASIFVALALAAIGPVLVWFFAEPKVLGITLAMALGILINMLSMLHVGLLRRSMQFGVITFIEVGAMIAGVVVGIASAKMGAGYWALVYQQLAVWIWQTVVTWIACPWRPESLRGSLFRRDDNVRSILRYGNHVTAARVFLYVGRNTDNLLIGHFVGATVLGIYQKSYQWAMMPFWQIYIPMSAVVISIFGRLRNDPQRYRTYLRTTLLGVFAIVLPMTALMYMEADNVVGILLGPQWVAAVPLLKMLTIGSYFSSFALVTTWIYMSEGRTSEQLRWAMVTSVLIMAAVSIGIHWGEMGVAIGFTVTSIVITLPSIWYCLRRSPFRASDYWVASWRATVSSIVAAAVLWRLRPYIPELPLLIERLIIDSATYGVIYITLWLALPQGWANGSAILKQLRAVRNGPMMP